jgi:hypothetical protein
VVSRSGGLEKLFKHECWEWDGLVIDEGDMEFACCRCFDDPLALQFSEERQKEIDDWNEEYFKEEPF